MASVMVFVDDAVRGTLPGICAKEGVATSTGLTIRSELGDRAGLGVAWLLLLAGPIGWLGLLLVWASRGGRAEVLTVQVPLSEPAHQRLRAARRMQGWCLALAVVAVPALLIQLVRVGEATLLSRAGVLLTLGLAIAAVVGVIVSERRVRRARIVVDLDASRRWVTLSGVHPAFVAACQAQDQQQGQRT